MNTGAQFAYAQARLQARHGNRPTEQLWQRLAGAGDLANFLQQAQRTSLRPWVLGMQATQTSHALELSLRQRFRGYIEEVASWLPGHWAAVVHPAKHLLDLPVLQFLLHGETAPPWLPGDAALRPFASENRASRREALHEAGRDYLVIAWQQGTPLSLAWLEHWQHQWPASRGFAAGLTYLGRLLRRYLEEALAGHTAAGDRLRQPLVAGLGHAFRRYSCEPAAACAHLGLVALDLEKLRGELLQRALFAETAGGRA